MHARPATPRFQGRSAWEETYVRHRSAVWSFAVALAGSSGGAEDLVQDTFVRLISRGSSPPDHLAYVLTTMRRVAMDAASRTRSRRQRESTASIRIDTPPLADAREPLMRAVLALSPDEREVLALRLWCDLEHRQIARVLEAPEGTIRARYSRAIERLRELLVRPGEIEVLHVG